MDVKWVRFHTGNTGRFEKVKDTKLGVDFVQDGLAQVEVLVALSGMQIDLVTVVHSSHVNHSFWVSCV